MKTLKEVIDELQKLYSQYGDVYIKRLMTAEYGVIEIERIKFDPETQTVVID